MPTNPKALLILNPNSRDGGQKSEEAVNCLNGLKVPFELIHLNPSINISELIENHPGKMVVIGGGDGTLNAAANGLVKHAKTLGLLPLGTANDLALSLGIPNTIPEACKVIADGFAQPIDLGWANGHHFFNVASIGLSVQITHALDPTAKRRFGKIAYLLATLKTLKKARPFNAIIESGDANFQVYSIQINIGNGRHFGGGLTIAEAASHWDGLLDVYSIEPERKWRMLSLFPALKRGSLDKTWGVRAFQGTEFKFKTKEPMAVNIDGEVRLSTPLHVRVVPKAISVFLPRPVSTA